LPKFDADEVFRLLPRATAMMGVPTFYVRLLGDPRLNQQAAQHMRVFISGSAPLLPDTYHSFYERTGHAILERYGMTETGMNTSNPYEGGRVPGAVGLPLPGVEIRIADPETGAILEPGETGMIEVRGPNVFKGYWRMPEKTKAEFRKDGFSLPAISARSMPRAMCTSSAGARISSFQAAITSIRRKLKVRSMRSKASWKPL
jgi:malonyl-CoA/methylmalonyl-CoA synthetase